MYRKFFLLILILSLFLIKAATYPNYIGFVNDYTNTLNSKEIDTLNALSMQLEKKTSIELVTVIIKDLGDQTIEEYANELFSQWKIGKKGKDNGILFITALNNKKTRIEVGYGLEGILPDGKTGAVLTQYILPYFRVGNFTQGLINGHVALANILAKENHVILENNQLELLPNAAKANNISFFVKVIFVVLFLLFLFFFGGNSWLLPLLFIGSAGGFNSRDFGGFGGGSGFGGFGGGFSGGGGASGSW